MPRDYKLYPSSKLDSNLLDPKIRPIVELLIKNGIETTSSCQGGRGHAFLSPRVSFKGSKKDAYRALRLVENNGWAWCSLYKGYYPEEGTVKSSDWLLQFNTLNKLKNIREGL
jgi:hypothetical protein